jgi:cell division protein FtsB
VRNNQHLKQKNKIKSIKLKAVNATDKELLESQARYRFGLIKKGCVIFSNSNDTTLDFFDIQQSFKCLVKHTQAIF